MSIAATTAVQAQPETAQDSDMAAARRVIETASEALSALSQSLNGEFSRAVEAIIGLKGRVIVSGMGKSGHIARKIAATLASTGTPAMFVHPGEASHGDLGMVTRDDAVIMLSYRGETTELGDLITHAKRLRIPLIGIAGNERSTLLQASDIPLLLPKAREACPMGLAPTTSTTMMLVLGDALAVALMEKRGFTADQYRDFHPGGSLGRLLIRVSDLMHQGGTLPLAKTDHLMKDVLLTLASHRFGCVGIVDDAGQLIGIITDGDLARHMDHTLLDRSAGEIMTRAPKCIAPEKLAAEALAQMNDLKITQLFVLDDAQRPTGLLHMHDCLRAGVG